MNQAVVTSVVERILDDPLAALADGGIGFVGPDVPVEVLLASGRAFGHLSWTAGRPTRWADRWLESSFPFWTRSILEQWHAGAFDGLSSVVFSRAADASQRLYYYVTELQRRDLLNGPEPVIFDVAHVRRELSVKHTAAAILKLCTALGVAPAELNGAIGQANALRRTLAGIEANRSSDGPWHERIGRAVLWSNPLQWLDTSLFPTSTASGPRVLLAGSVPPDDRIHRAVEAAGASVVAEAHMYGSGRLGPEIVIDAERPALALARQLQLASMGPRAMIDHGEWIVERARAARAAAVIIWLTREDEALAWHVPPQTGALDAAGIGRLVLPAAHWQFNDQSPDRLVEFLTADVDATN